MDGIWHGTFVVSLSFFGFRLLCGGTLWSASVGTLSTGAPGRNSCAGLSKPFGSVIRETFLRRQYGRSCLQLRFGYDCPRTGECRPLYRYFWKCFGLDISKAFRRGMLYYLCDGYGIHPDDLRILLLVVCMGIAFFVGIGLWKQGGSTSRNLLELLEDGVVTFEEELAAWRAVYGPRT